MSSPTPKWKVTGTTPTVRFTPGTGPVEGFDVSFVTDTNITGTVFVATAQVSNTAFVAATITERVAHLDAIHNLNG